MILNNCIFYFKILKSYILGFIILIIISIVSYKLFYTNNYSKKYYSYKAYFSNVEGLTKKTPVMLFGYKVGYIKNIYLDKTYSPIVILAIDKKVKIPDDSTINIKENGIMGNKLLQLNLGIENNILSNESAITFTNNGITYLELLTMLINYVSNIKNNIK